jgi:hypothetical protein
MANNYGSHQEIHSKIWIITYTFYYKALPNFDCLVILTQNEKQSLTTFGKNLV